ncbi:MAG: leucyl aminopeptidase [Bacillota bacterium]
MELSVKQSPLLDVKCDSLILAVHPEEITPSERALDAAIDGAISRRRESGGLRTDRGELNYFHGPTNRDVDRVVLVGLGEKELDGHRLLRVFAEAARATVRQGASCVAIDLSIPGFGGDREATVIQGAMLGGYSFRGYKKSDEDRTQLRELYIGYIDPTEGDLPTPQAVRRNEILGFATLAARDLGNEPANLLTPVVFAERSAEMAAEMGLGCEVYGEEELREFGMGVLLGVARGSEEPPRVIELTYGPKREDVPTLVLVGKGLTFDSGGISIKSSQGMHEMKMDMCGAAAVHGAMKAIAALKPSGIRVIGLIGAVENMPDGRALKPGDVLRACDGTSVEVINTDAEGRLVLGDLLAYAAKTHDPAWIVDAATLTGAVMVALGDGAAGVIASDDDVYSAVREAGESVGERFWQLPSYEEYEEELKSEIADLKNSGSRNAGAITGGLFIGSFRAEKTWAHLDIAGMAWTDKASGLDPIGATGFGARTLAVLPEILLRRR